VKIHEYQAKAVFREFGIPTSRGELVEATEQAAAALDKVGLPCVVKSQVLVGGRGKAGGVRFVRSREEYDSAVDEILGMRIKGLTVEKLLIDEAVDIAEELYLGVVLDRSAKRPVFMVSAAGGVEIEVVAAETPEKLLKLPIDPTIGFRGFHGRRLAAFLHDDPAIRKQLAEILAGLYQLFMAKDCSLAEINPCVITGDGEATAIDAKINFDDNALFRHPDIAELRDMTAEDPLEVKAKEAGLSYVNLDGTVGCLVNGAGLAMTTMDLIKHFGAEPANFLDVGGSSNPQKVLTAMEIITSDANVKSILLNIFGGITRCDDIANGLIQALEQRPLEVPLIVRLTGTNEEEGRAILEEHGIEAGSDLDQAVRQAVTAAQGV